MRYLVSITALAGCLAGPAFAYAPKVECALDAQVTRGLASLEEVDSQPVGSSGLARLELYRQAGS